METSRGRILRGEAALEELRPAWEALAERVDAPAFQRHAWLSAWFRHMAPDADPWIAVVGDPVEGLVPLALRGRRGLRRLELAGQGVSDYLGPLADSPESAARLMACLEQGAGRVDWVDLCGLGDDPVTQAFAGAVRRTSERRRYEPCPAVDTSGSWEDYLAGRKKKFRANLKRTDRRTREHGTVEVGRVTPSDALFEEMVEVERASWKWEGGFAALRDPARRAFVKQVLLDEGVAQQLWTVRIDDDLAAFAWLFPTARTWHYYLPSFKASYNDVGTFLLGELVRACFESEASEFDFGQGDEAYKRHWTTHEHQVDQLAIAGGGWAGRFAVAATRARWRFAQSERLREWRTRALTRWQRLAGR